MQNITISIERLKTTLGESAVEGALEDFVEFVLANLRWFNRVFSGKEATVRGASKWGQRWFVVGSGCKKRG